MEGAPGLIRKSSVFAAVGVLLSDVWIFLKKKRKAGKLGMTLISAGAFSNVYDRLIRGRVVDYIGIRRGNKKLSDLTANLADVYLMVGMMFYGVSWLAHRKKKVK